MAKVLLSKRLRAILRDPAARLDFARALDISASRKTPQEGTLAFKGTTYRVIAGPLPRRTA